MNPSPEAIDKVRERVTDWSQTDEEIAGALNAPSIANPAPRGKVPHAIKESELSLLLIDTSQPDPYVSLRNVLNWTNFGLVKADIETQNRAGAAQWAAKLQILGLINASQAAAIQTYAMSTDDDPDYQAQVSWATANLGRPVDTFDIAASRT